MRVLVLMKAVAGNTGGYTGAGRSLSEIMPNPADITALEEALKLKDALGCTVTVITMGPKAVASMLKDALARGADEAVLLSDGDFAGADTAATSRTLAAAINHLGGYELILCGRKTTDGETGQVGAELATRLNIECILSCCEISVNSDSVRCSCLLDGARGSFGGRLPILLSVVYGINSPRLPSLAGLRQAKRKEIICLDRAALGIAKAQCGQDGSPTRVLSSYSSPFEKRRPVFTDAAALSQRLRELRGAADGKGASRG